MDKKFHGNRIWQIVYPLGAYYALYSVLYTVFKKVFAGVGSPLLWLGVASALTIPFIYGIYKQMPVVRSQKQFDKDTIVHESLYILGIVALGVLLNVVITHTPLMEQSAGFAQANEVFQVDSLLTKVFTNCICIPILEEIVYRGIIAGQLMVWRGPVVAIILSSLLFGAMHFNMVQFLYAFLVGLALAYVYTKTNKLWVVIAAHGLTNLAVVLWQIVS
ncbi:MAG: type II CAAX endopeptidase family protein [Lachnospiraceae bacterium]|nr:type II CAAX endopeptidase family protein [Lachnospiraceae bacterium]